MLPAAAVIAAEAVAVKVPAQLVMVPSKVATQVFKVISAETVSLVAPVALIVTAIVQVPLAATADESNVEVVYEATATGVSDEP